MTSGRLHPAKESPPTGQGSFAIAAWRAAQASVAD